MKAKAAVLYEVGQPVVVEQLDLESPGPGEVMVRVAGTGVCHSDYNVVSGFRPPGALPVAERKRYFSERRRPRRAGKPR